MSKTFLQFMMNEDNNSSHAVAKHHFERLKGAAGTVGSHKGSVRVYSDHKGGTLHRTTVGEINHQSYGTNKTGHHFAERYSARPGHEVHTYAHFQQHTNFTDHEHIHSEVERQNPHHPKGTGHARSLSSAIIKHHGHEEDLSD